MTRRHFIASGTGAIAAAWTATLQAKSAQKFEVTHTDAEWKKILTQEQFEVLRREATEAPFSSPLLHEKRKGTFLCAGCGLDLFASSTKFDSGTGWPSFWNALNRAVLTKRDTSLGMVRDAVYCRRCGGHLGHVFDDGPQPTGLRYCINGVALAFKPATDATRRRAAAIGGALILALAGAPMVAAQEMPPQYRDVLTFLGKSGDFKDAVLKVNIPRNDVSVTVAGIATPTPFGFGGWVAMTKGTGMDVMMGDLVLLQDEVDPVMSALLEHGIEVTALHNHFFRDEPRMFYMHVHAHGAPMDLAREVKPALDLIGRGAKPASPAAAAPPSGSPIQGDQIARIAGHTGEQNGAVYKITVGRSDFKMTEMGAVINARMGLNSWAAFTGTQDKAAVAGDIAMLPAEVTPVLNALRKNGLSIVAMHHHMIDTRPAVIFLHYWGTGPADQLAAGFKAALDQLGKK